MPEGNRVLIALNQGARLIFPGKSRIPRTVWALGFVSMFMDVSSEMIHSLLPLFIVTGLGASPAVLGLIEGLAEATASLTKVFSGWLSDRLRKRKLLALIGYGAAALTKPVFPIASTTFEIFCARFADRVGKGIRGAPRDALIADVTSKDGRGAAYGLRQSLDTIGAVVGPLAAMAIMIATSGDIRAVFWWAVLPAFAAVLILFLGVKEERQPEAVLQRASRLQLSEFLSLDRTFWVVVVVGAIFTLARFSEAFLLLRAQEVGFDLALVPVVMVVMNIVYALVSAPAGHLSDTLDRRWVLGAGLVVLIVADVVLAQFDHFAGVLVGSALWGLHMGLSQGLLSALVADAAPEKLRGTAFGVFHFVTGFALLAASAFAGWVWSAWGSQATFLSGALLALLALIGLIVAIRR